MNPLDSRLRGNDPKAKDKDRTSGSRLAACFADLGRDVATLLLAPREGVPLPTTPTSPPPSRGGTIKGKVLLPGLKGMLGLGFGQVGPVEADHAGDGLDEGLSQGIGVGPLVRDQENISVFDTLPEEGGSPYVQWRAKIAENPYGELAQGGASEIEKGSELEQRPFPPEQVDPAVSDHHCGFFLVYHLHQHMHGRGGQPTARLHKDLQIRESLALAAEGCGDFPGKVIERPSGMIIVSGLELVVRIQNLKELS